MYKMLTLKEYSNYLPFNFIVFVYLLVSQTLRTFSVLPETNVLPSGLIARLYILLLDPVSAAAGNDNLNC
jgi:hypothetical protein